MTSNTVLRSREKVDNFISRVEVISRPRPFTKKVTQEKKKPEFISRSAYWADAKARWNYHLQETEDLWKDIVKLSKFIYEQTEPYITKTINTIQEWIKAAKKLITKKK